MRKLAIIGSSDLARLVAQLALTCGWELAGFIDNRSARGTQVDDFGQVLGGMNCVEELAAAGKFDALAVGVGYLQFQFRKHSFEAFSDRIEYPPLIHPSSFIHPTCRVGRGAVVLPGCTVDWASEIGDNALLNTGVIVAHHTNVGAHSFVGPGAAIAGKVTIGESCFIGINSTIIDHLSLCAGTNVAGGAVVVGDSNQPGWYVGSPARYRPSNKE
jgi:sugar O-acyltransferase (sialic acid O-acetyltransferase NeuD family)